MLVQRTVSKKKPTETALDHEALYELGLAHVQRLARRLWTDYNVHDPGVTTLEMLCYALTDLAYRATFPVEDLVASATDNAARMREQFFTAREILPNRPLTVLDYRKLLIDLPGVKNAWLAPEPLSYCADTVRGRLLRTDPGIPGIEEVPVSGLYRVTIEYMDHITTAAGRERVLQDVRQRLDANRNLCEEFVSFAGVETQDFLLCAELTLAPDADTAQVQAEILFKVQQHLAPSVANYSLSEMLARTGPDGAPLNAAAIFDGPLLDCGFIDDAELSRAELPSAIHLSDIISILMDIEGVQAVRDIVFNAAPTDPEMLPEPPVDKWRVEVDSGKKALLDTAHSRLVFYKRGMPVTPDPAQAAARYAALCEAARTKAETEVAYDFEIPLGRFRKPGDYYSFQNHFPALYGLSDLGLVDAADKKREALALQLKGYLLFFDQVMANYFAQLAQVKELFSTDPAQHRTYFYQAVDSFRDWKSVYAEADPVAAMESVEDTEVQLARRNRFLNHLIARFGERFHEYAAVMRSAFGTSPARLVADKCAFLAGYPALSSERGTAYNAGRDDDDALWNSGNISGLEKRLAGLLGLRDSSRRNLGDIAYDLYAEVDSTPGDEFRFRIRNRDTGSILLSSSTHYATPELARAEMRRAINFGQDPGGYERKVASDGRHYFNVVDDTGEVLARRIEYFESEEAMNGALDEVITYLQVHYSDEGMYVIENILLRPELATDPFLPICPLAENTHPASLDPYSYRIHVILPAYGNRFDNMEFRRYAESVIREETPAHILPKVCWVSREDMAVFEKCYRDWIYLRSGREWTDRQGKLERFVEILFAVKNVYPPAQIHACGGSETERKFLLGKTALGSMGER